MFFKGVLASLAGPAPNYDMQRILATRNPREACLMNGMVNVVLYFPRYLMVAGLTVMAFAFCMPELRAMDQPDFEKLLPLVLARAVPVGVLGLLLAGLLAAFMSNFAATVNAAPAYIVNDIYKRFIHPDSPPKTDVLLSRIASVVVLARRPLLRPSDHPHHRHHDVDRGRALRRLRRGQRAQVVLVALQRLRLLLGHGDRHRQRDGRAASARRGGRPPGQRGLHDPVHPRPLDRRLPCSGRCCTAAEDDAILKSFYRTVRPWGFWGPIRDKVMAEDPAFVPNRDFARDCTNVAVGIVWQVSLAALPIYIVLRDWRWAGAIAAVTATTSVFLKFNWYDKLEKA